MKASLTAVAALLALGLAAPAFAQTAVPAPTAAPSVTTPAQPAKKAQVDSHKSTAQVPAKKDETINKDATKSGAVGGTAGATTGSATAPKAVPEKKAN
jgi:hypothetical protein